MANGMNMALGLNFDLLKNNLVAMYEKDENKKESKILLMPTKVDEPSSVTFAEMIEDFKNVLGMKSEGEGSDIKKIEGDLQSFSSGSSSFKLENITAKLQSAYLYKTMPESGEGELEYAIGVAVDMGEALPDFGFFKLNSLFLAVWNTERKAVVRQIGCGRIADFLSELDA